MKPMVLEDPVYKYPMSGGFQITDPNNKVPKAHVPYRIESADGRVMRGVTDENGFTQHHHSLDSAPFTLTFE